MEPSSLIDPLAEPLIHVDVYKAMELLERVVAEKGEDFVAKECHYQVNGRPHCVVGQVAFLAGETIENLKVWDRDGEPDAGSIRITSLHTTDSVTGKPFPQIVQFDRGAMEVLRDVQCEQDQKATWGTVLRAAREKFTKIIESKESRGVHPDV